MSGPPPYPRIAHLVAGRGTRDDLELSDARVAALLGRPVVVEEKLDGANVVIWADGGRINCALRSGVGGQDRAGQLGPLRAWLGARIPALQSLLSDGRALYAEWLLLTHTVAYDALPSHLVGLDVFDGAGEPLPVDQRNALLDRAGLAHPPELFRGRLGGMTQLEGLLGLSRVGAQPMEGLIVRPLDGREPRLAKLVRPGFVPLPDAQWAAGRPRNGVAPEGQGWA